MVSPVHGDDQIRAVACATPALGSLHVRVGGVIEQLFDPRHPWVRMDNCRFAHKILGFPFNKARTIHRLLV